MSTTLIVMSSFVLPLIVGWLVATRFRSADKGRFAYFQCPGCRQRLRFRARKAGRQALCPNCYQCATLPG